MKLLCLPFLLAVFWYRPEKPQPGEFFLDILDVGQGLAVVITTREHVLLYDTGPAFSPRFNAGSGIIEPFLRKQNISTPDRIVISHADLDHAGGYPFLGSQYPQTEIFVGEKFSGLRNFQFCEAGQQWQWDSVQFEFLYPDQHYEGNNASCVLKISAGAYSVLLPGDIEAVSELNLVRQNRDKLMADVLLAPHHGSRTSSTMPLVRAVGAQYVIFSTGYLNRFNHPHPSVISRYENQQVTILDTATTGHIRFQISDRLGVNSPEIYRNLRPRFWSERYIRAP